MMMDDCCVVCAETLEWVAYGPCGHREVCATCVARLRFVCSDRRCCLCQSDSTFVFVTKALGEYTKLINDFSIFPEDVKEGKVGSFWYHEETQAFFDDFHQYGTVRAMLKLSCSVCDSADCKAKEGSKRKVKFRSIDHLRSHLSNRHELFMCSLCLEGRKVFISEQKLYSRAQLKHHFEKGDSEVDGNESERCGFSGHPLCEFCGLNFYGDNELYFHLGTDHFTCHICKRQDPDSHQYYRDYDDLEKHFRHTHYLCEDSSCLEKKFIVFASVADMKRHHALEHGENMSRSERNASLQYRERERRGRRGMDQIAHAQSPRVSIEPVSLNRGTSVTGLNFVSSGDRVTSSAHSLDPGLNLSNGLLENSAFPPLPSSSNRRQRKSRNPAARTAKASQLQRRYDGSLALRNPPPVIPAANGQPSSSSASSSFWGSSPSNSRPASLQSTASLHPENSMVGTNLTTIGDHSSSRSADSPSNGNGNGNGIRKVSQGSPATSTEEPENGRGTQKTEEIQSVNKSAIERIRADLGFDKDKFAAFKFISKEYRQGVINAKEYLAYVRQFSLSHLIADLASLCPDPQKQKELMESALNGETYDPTAKTITKKGKEKCIDHGSNSSAAAEPTSTSRKGKEICTSETAVKDPTGISNSMKGKEKLKAEIGKLSLTEPNNQDMGGFGDGSDNPSTGVKKTPKKTPKFLRARLGESASSTSGEPKSGPGQTRAKNGQSGGLTGTPPGGAWQNGGGRKLFVAVTKSQASRR